MVPILALDGQIQMVGITSIYAFAGTEDGLVVMPYDGRNNGANACSIPAGGSIRIAAENNTAINIKAFNDVGLRIDDADSDKIISGAELGMTMILKYLVTAAAIARSRIVVMDEGEASRPERKRWQRARRKPPTLRWIKLRKVVREARDSDPTGRHLTTRHIRRGHFRTVLYGKGRSQERLDWFPPTIVGPEGTPLIVKAGRVFSLER